MEFKICLYKIGGQNFDFVINKYNNQEIDTLDHAGYPVLGNERDFITIPVPLHPISLIWNWEVLVMKK